jgi:hypothetical protein
MMSDDLAVSEAFDPHERAIASRARVVIRPPRRVADLLRRRVRVATGTTQLARARGLRSDSKPALSMLFSMVRHQQCALLDVVVFVSVAVIARTWSRQRVRNGNFATWDRDESSRAN